MAAGKVAEGVKLDRAIPGALACGSHRTTANPDRSAGVKQPPFSGVRGGQNIAQKGCE